MDGGQRRGPFDFDSHLPDSNKHLYTQMDSRHRHRSTSSPLFVRQTSESSPDGHARPPVTHLALPSLRSHFPRDGFDYRRPASSALSNNSANNVIDLTSDDDPAAPPTPPQPPAATLALPRFGREIIDLSADTSPARTTHPAHPRSSLSPEVQFVSSRPRSRTEQRPSQPPAVSEQDPEQRHRVSELILDDDDVVEQGSRTGVNLLGPLGAQRRQNPGTLARFIWGEGASALRAVRAAYATMPRRNLPTFTGAAEDHDLPHPDRPFFGLPGLPGFMNYETVAFNVTGDDQVQLPLPKFDPPPPVAEGFTRDPTEEDTIICPNCEDELAVGESEEKRQVWVVKGCGHVYCGTCMNNRKRRVSKGTKGKGRADEPLLPKPFAACRVDDCGIRVSHKNDVMQIFL